VGENDTKALYRCGEPDAVTEVKVTMKLSDYVMQFLEDLNVKDVFLLSGGGMMHLLDSLGRSHIHPYYNLNEQATSICADAYAQYTNEMSVCMVTTGPGGTNAVTGVVSAYQDSTPMLVISGQVKTADFAPEGVRVYGPQEVNITRIVSSVTKYAVTVTKPEEIRYHLEKAVYLATHGRRGPVWIDIPLDVQAGNIEPDKLKGYEPEETCQVSLEDSVENMIRDLSAANKPVLLFGHGVMASRAAELARDICNYMKIPVLTTWRAKEIFREDDPYYFGEPGSQAPRYSNFVLQRSDCLLVVGSRLDWSLTAYDEPGFAPKAKKYIVDIDRAEMDKLDICFEKKICCDAHVFLDYFHKKIKEAGYSFDDRTGWIETCRKWKQTYPIYNERMSLESDAVWGYDFAKVLTESSDTEDIFVASPTGRVCIAMNLGIALKGNQRFVAPRGLGSMGYALPCAIGACVAGGYRRTICFEGDGSLQHNIQELQLIVTYHLPIKLFIYNNGGYSSIYGMQGNHFCHRLAGCTPESGVSLPVTEKIANAYGIKYDCIKDSTELKEGISRVLADNEAVICEVMGDIRYEEIPRTQTRVHADGSITSSSMEDLYPFLEK
jgi:acetolactate synthase-1/2/3 large subunit